MQSNLVMVGGFPLNLQYINFFVIILALACR